MPTIRKNFRIYLTFLDCFNVFKLGDQYFYLFFILTNISSISFVYKPFVEAIQRLCYY